MYIYDVKQDKWICPVEGSGDFFDASFDKDGNIMVLRHPKEDQNASAYYDNNYLYEATVILEMFSSNGKSLWKNEFNSTTTVINTSLASTEYAFRDESKVSAVGASFANHYVIVDKKTGKTYKNVEFPGSIVSVGFSESDGLIITNIVTQNGNAYFLPHLDGYKQISSRKYFPDGTRNMESYKTGEVSSYFIEDSSERVITEFSGRFSDTKFVGFDGTLEMPVIRSISKTQSGEYFIAFSEKGNKISGIDVKNNKGLWTIDMPVCKTLVAYNAYSSDNKYVYMLKETADDNASLKCNLIRINCLTGAIEDVNSEFSFYGLIATESNGTKIYAASDEKDAQEKITLYSYDIATDTVKKVIVNIKELDAFAYIRDTMAVSPDGKKVILYLRKTDDKQTKTIRLIVDTETGKFTASECGDCSNIAWNDQGTLFAEANNEGNITVSSIDGKERYKIDTELRIPLGMEFYENRLYVVYNVDVLCSYNSIGKQIMSINLKHGDVDSNKKVSFEFVRQTLFVTAGDYTDIIDILDKKSIGSFSGYLCLYNKKEAEKDMNQLRIVAQTLIVNNEKISRVGWFEYKGVPQMLKEAKEYLDKNGVTMSEDFRKKYGIE